MKNKGFTLIELVVAIAVGSIILLMVGVMLVRGTSIFRTENDEVNMRNDYQIVRNQIDQVLMEAKTLIIEERENGDLVIYTGDIITNKAEKNRHFASSDITTERIIAYEKEKKSLYISGSYDACMVEGNRICNIVKSFDIELDDVSKREEIDSATGKKTIYYVNPMRVNVTLNLAQKQSDMASSYSVNLRNKLTSITIYKVKNGGTLLSAVSADNIQQYKVK